ncbi:MAG: sterol desaturase family protein [Actinomycetota bacterium]
MKWFSGALAVGAFAVLYLLEKKRPLRRQVESKEIETVRNLAIASFAAVIFNYLEKPVTGKLTAFVERNNFGILKIFRLPKFAETVLAVVLLDYTLYHWHVLTHKLPFLWRFHKIHHADRDLTASTAVRFHFGEITISVLFRAGQILIIGVSPYALQIWQTLLFASVFFHHSNIKLPKDFERKLEKIMMTPRLHGIHHSAEEAEMNSNWSSGLTVWDFLHGTFLSGIPQNEITIGVKNMIEENTVTIGKMLAAPFLKDKKNGKTDFCKSNLSE